jgi:hypothetical protein
MNFDYSLFVIAANNMLLFASSGRKSRWNLRIRNESSGATQEGKEWSATQSARGPERTGMTRRHVISVHTSL